MATASTTTKKTRGAKASEDLEPLAPIFLDDEEEEGEEEEDEPAPKAKPARNIGSLLAPVKSDDDEDDGPESDDDVQVEAPAAGKKPHAAALYWQEAKRVGPAHAKVALLKKLAERVQMHRADIGKWGNDPQVILAIDRLSEAASFLDSAAEKLGQLPLGWTPPARTPAASSKTLPEGARVSVKQSARAEYDGALEPEEMVGLTVVRHEPGKSKVACKTTDGSRVVIPRAHLEICADEPAAQE